MPIRRILLCLAGLAAWAPAGLLARPAAVMYSQDQLVAALTRDLATRYQLDGDLVLDVMSRWAPPAMTASVWQVSLDECPDRPMSTMVLRCHLIGDGETLDDFSLLVHASVWRDGWFAREPLYNGMSLDPSMFDVHRVDCLQDRDALPVNVGIRSFIASRQVSTDRVLTWHDVALRPLVRKGEMIDVVAEDGMLVVTLKALALQNGAQGDLVTARNLESNREITGRVVGEDCIAISF